MTYLLLFDTFSLSSLMNYYYSVILYVVRFGHFPPLLIHSQHHDLLHSLKKLEYSVIIKILQMKKNNK